MIELIKKWWNQSTGFRHAVTTWLGVQLAVPLAQIAAWAQAKAAGAAEVPALPDWEVVLATLWYASLAAGISALLKVWQHRRAFPTRPDNPQ